MNRTTHTARRWCENPFTHPRSAGILSRALMARGGRERILGPAAVRALIMLSLISVGAAFAQDYTIDWHTTDGGGQMWSTGDGFDLGGTIGQADAGVMTGTGYEGTFTLTGGFWATPPCWCLADMNHDGQRNGEDIQHFVDCILNGGPDCICADVVTDGDLDLIDVDIFVGDLLTASACP